MKKSISYILALVMFFTACNLAFVFTSTAEESFTIKTAKDLAELGQKINDSQESSISVYLEKNIDASSLAKFDSIDAGGKSITFNGNNKLISNLNIVGSGLFSKVGSGSSFTSLGMYNIYLSNFSAKGSGYGILCGTMSSGTVTNCFAEGKIVIYGGAQNIGGLIGKYGGSNMQKCFTIVDIYTDGSYVGGLVGRFSGSADNSISYCYSTGSIENKTNNYIGGLIGYSDVSCVKDSYTSTCILNVDVGTVKSVGNIKNLSATVYYDKNLSLQRQGDMDVNRCTPAEINAKFSNNSNWKCVDGYYPQLAVFFASSVEAYNRISAISAAVVDIDRGDGLTTGREFTVLSSSSRYSFATLTRFDETKHAGIDEKKLIDWHISGGIDEYYFNPSVSDSSGFSTNNGNIIDGLSGTTYDANTGKYLFVNTGDIKFTAYSGNYSRDIFVHVTTSDKTPYIYGGTGKENDPFLINDINELSLIRFHCIDDMYGDYYYKLVGNDEASSGSDAQPVFDFENVEWLPIIGMKGTFLGNNFDFVNLNITQSNEGCAGLFATISNKCYIYDLHISDAIINTPDATYAGILAGYASAAVDVADAATQAHIDGVMATGNITAGSNVGTLIGAVEGNTKITRCLTMGLISGTENIGGVVGNSSDEAVSGNTYSPLIENCYSCSVVMNGSKVAGIAGNGTADIKTSIFTGMLEPKNGGSKYGITGGDQNGVENSYFDWQAANILNSTSEQAKSTEQLNTKDSVPLDNTVWSWISRGAYTGTNSVYKGYPQLLFYSSKTLTNQNDIYNKGRTARTSMLAATPIVYYNAGESGKGSSTSGAFATAKYNVRYQTSKMYDLSQPVLYNANSDGYTITPTKDASGAAYAYTLTLNTGGAAIYTLSTGSNYPNYHMDTRYLLMNVRSIDVYYKFDVEGAPAYSNDMNNKALVDITTELGTKYGVIMDSTVNDYTRLMPTGDRLTFDMTLGPKYKYKIDVYSDATDTNKLAMIDEKTVSVTGVSAIYIKITITANTLPWGVYKINCSE